MISTTASMAPHEFVLHNGLRVVIASAAAAPVATLMVLYKVGARNEAVGYTGSSHLLEHMLFKGTPANNRSNGRAFADIMNEIGASKNATTWIDRTNYFETVPLEYLPYAIELEADRMRGALVADADRRSEMTVVRNELERHDNSAGRVLNLALVATAFREHPYHHPTIGWRTDVEGVTTDRLRELYDTFYHPNNATIFVTGDVDVERTRDLIERHFGALPASVRAIPDVYTSEPPQVGERSVAMKRPGDDAILAYAYHTPAALGGHDVRTTAQVAALAEHAIAENDGDALDVLARVLGRGKTSRLSRALVDGGFALDASAWDWGSRDPGLFQVAVTVRPGVALDDVRRETDAAIDALLAHGPTDAEVERATEQLVVQRAFARDGTYGLAQRLAEYEAVGTWHLDDAYVERVRAVTAERVRDVARRYLHEDNRTRGTLVPGTPRTHDVVPFEPIAARADAAAVEPPSAPLPTPTAPAATRRFADRIARATLPNAIVSSFVEAPDSAIVHLRGIIDAGPAFAPGRPMLPSIVGALLARGTASQGRIEIEERLERAGVRRGYVVDDEGASGSDPLAFRFVAASTVAALPLALETLAQELREPAFFDHELALVKDEYVGALRLLRTNTAWRALQRFSELAYEAGDTNAVPSVDALLADVEATGLDDVRDYHARVVLGGALTLSAAGGIDASAFERAIRESLGNVPFQPSARANVAAAARVSRAVDERIAIERKANVDIVFGAATSLRRADADYLAATIANGILGQSTLSSRLGLRLRDREGLTYGITSSFVAAGRVAGPWRIGVGVNPANVDRAIASVRDVVGAYVADGPTAREFDQQRNSMAGSHRVALASNAGIATQLERIATYGLGDAYVDTYRDRLDAVTLGDVRASAARYFVSDEAIVVAAGTLAP